MYTFKIAAFSLKYLKWLKLMKTELLTLDDTDDFL